MSNATIPEAERQARGQARLQLRVDQETVTLLDELVTAANESAAHLPAKLRGRWNRSDFVAAIIQGEYGRAARRKARPAP